MVQQVGVSLLLLLGKQSKKNDVVRSIYCVISSLSAFNTEREGLRLQEPLVPSCA